MSTIRYLDTVDQLTVRHLSARGEGTEIDPYVPLRDIVPPPLTFTETTLTAPNTGTTGRDARGFQYLQFLITVSSVGTSLVVRPETSPDNVTWFPLGEDYTITANGNDTISFSYPQPLQYVRLFFVSETGSSSTTVNVVTVIQ